MTKQTKIFSSLSIKRTGLSKPDISILSEEFKKMEHKNIAIANYQSRLVDSTVVIKELIELAKKITKAADQGKDLGLSEDEYAFYEALSSNMTAKETMGTDILKEIAIELTKKIKANTTIDWNIRNSVRSKIQFEIKVLLKKYKYPPDDPKDPNNYHKSIKLIMDQTELLAEEIASGL